MGSADELEAQYKLLLKHGSPVLPDPIMNPRPS